MISHTLNELFADPIRRRLIVVMTLTLGVAAGVAYLLLSYAQTRIIEHQAVTLAESVARMATTARSVYATEVAEKLRRDGFGPDIDFHARKGYIPLPAQFLKKLGHAARKDSADLHRYRPLSKWNLEPTQGLNDDFQRWGWSQLEAQDRANPPGPIDWEPVWRFEEIGGAKSLRYMWADPASAESCVNCHNQYEQRPDIQTRRIAAGVEPGKKWQRHQLMGAIEVDIPLKKVELLALEQTHQTTAGIIAALLFGLALSVWYMIRDVRHLRRTMQLSWQATHDPLTGLVNRRGFEESLEDLLVSGTSDDKEHALFYLDLDHFKEVNDRYGHSAGDDLLKLIAILLNDNVRRNDTVARLGGDEFAVLLAGCGRLQAKEIAENIRRAISESRFGRKRRDYDVGASIGVVILRGDQLKTPDILRAADAACYAAKKAGRNQVFIA